MTSLKQISQWFIIIICLFASSFVTEVQSSSSTYNVWPLPKEISQTDRLYLIDSKTFRFSIDANDWKCDILETALERYRKRIFLQDCLTMMMNGREFHHKHHHDNRHNNYDDDEHYFFNNKNYLRYNYYYNYNDDNFTSLKNLPSKSSELNNLTELIIKVNNKCDQLIYNTIDESYSIDIPMPNDNDNNNQIAMIESNSVWGALKGLETFSQLIKSYDSGRFLVNQTKINDEPRFKYRGLLIDSSRHFLSKSTILKMLDAMEMNKLNVLHWHLVDDQSFPFVSKIYPNLSLHGSYDLHYQYQPDDVEEIIDYANQRGIRILPEFDSPGHTQSWGRGQPNLLTQCYDDNGQPLPGQFGPINPQPNSTYEFLQKFFTEISIRFPDSYIHLGGDEVDFGCWSSNPQIKNFMKQKSFGQDYRKLENYYMENLLKIIERVKKNPIVWQEVFDNQNNLTINKTTTKLIVNLWKAPWEDEMIRLTKSNHKVILSAPWYLNYIKYGGEQDWRAYYQSDPYNFDGTQEQKNLIEGGEICLWGEFIDSTNLIQYTWPRASAVAERLWSQQQQKLNPDTIKRIEYQRCRMQSYGLAVQPILGPDYCWCDDMF